MKLKLPHWGRWTSSSIFIHLSKK